MIQGEAIKRIGSIVFCAVFFAMALAPLVLMPWAQNSLTENRPPAPAPMLFAEGGLNLSLPGEVEEYFKDRFAGRTQLIDAYSTVVGGIFAVSANDKVVMGRDGWLFFQETLGDYDGSAALSDGDMDLLIRNLREIKLAAEARGQTFLIAVAPNKNTIYKEYMPSRYIREDTPTNLDRLLAAEGLDCIDLRATLLSSDQMIYYKTDSHWNGLGSRIAAREIMLTIEEKTGVKADFDWEGAAYADGVIIGDLGRMLYPANTPQEPDRFYEDAAQAYTTVGRYRGLDDLHITTESGGAQLSIALFRDSFSNALIPYFSNAYSNVYYTRQMPPPINSDAITQADVIVLIIAERRLPELLTP